MKSWQKTAICAGTVMLLTGGVYGLYTILSKNTQETETGVAETILVGDSGEITLKEGENLISKAGIYHITGTISSGYIHINADEKDEVKIILDNVSITNSNGPAIYVESNGNTYIELVGTNTINATTNDTLKGAIHSKADLRISGDGSVNITSSIHGIVCKDDLEIDSGTFVITSGDDGINANDSATFKGGIFTIKATGDGIHADGYLEFNGGTFDITATEGLEATYVKINDGNVTISASDDGVNASNKSSDYEVTFEMNGGTLTITMGQGDTDGIDSNGNLYINGGTVNVTGQSPFDYDGEAKYTGGTMIINGTRTTEITNQFAGQAPGGQGGNPNQPGGQMMRR